MISNLIRNALKFTPRIDSKIEISLEKVNNDREFVTAIIKDNGSKKESIVRYYQDYLKNLQPNQIKELALA